MKSKILESVKYYSLSGIFLKIINILSIFIFSRLLSTSEYGVVSILVAILTIGANVFSLGIDKYIGTIKRYSQNIYQHIQSYFTISSIFLIVILTSVYVIFDIFKIREYNKFFILLSVVGAYFLSVYNISLIYLDYKIKYKITALLELIVAICRIILSIIFINMFNSYSKVLMRLIGLILPTLIISLIFILIFYKNSRGLFFIDKFRFDIVKTLPLMFSSFGVLIIIFIDRIIISHICGNDYVGIYSLSYGVASLINFANMRLNKSWQIYYLRSIKSKYSKEKISNNVKKYNQLMFIITTTIILISPEFVKILSPNAYWDGISIIYPVSLGLYFIFLTSIFSTIEKFEKITYPSFFIVIISMIINIIGNIIFIKMYGYKAAGWVTLFSYFIIFVLHYFYVFYKIKLKLININIFIKEFIIIFLIYFIFIKTINGNLQNLILRYTILGLIVIFYSVELRLWKILN